MRRNFAGCAICDSTWGDYWEEVEGERTFFCCALCAIQFQNLVRRVRESTGWDRIDALEIAGDRRGRHCEAVRAEEHRRFSIAFNSDGEIRLFRPEVGPMPVRSETRA